MYQTRGAAWIGFEEAQKTINALKEEVEEAERKLSKAKKVLKHDRGDTVNKFYNLETPLMNVTHNTSPKNEHTRHFVKEVVPMKQPNLERLHKKRGTLTVPTILKFSSDSEEQQNLVPSTISSMLNDDTKLLKLSSSESESWHRINKHKSSSSEKTSSLLADTYTNIGSKLTSIINRNENIKDSQITFTPWEEQFLKSYVDISDVEVVSSQSDKPLENITNDMEWTPVINGGKLPRTKVKKTTDERFLSLKQIIDRQKRLHEENYYNGESRISPIENIDPPLISKYDTKTSALEDFTYNDIKAESETRPPPTRKVRLVTSLPRYRGFSAPTSFSRNKVKHFKKPTQNITVIKRNVKSKSLKSIQNENVASSPILKKQKNLEEKEESKGLTEIDAEENSDTNLCAKSSDILSKSNSSKENDKEIIETKITDKVLLENDKINSHEDCSENSDMNSDIDSQTSVAITEEKIRFPKFLPVSKSIKRKSFKVHAEEKLAPSPKIRHYDTKAVRDYIKKKKSERRKRHLEDHKKTLEQAERKKESLQKLLDFQKENLALSTKKTLSPAKIPQKKIESGRSSKEHQFLSEFHQSSSIIKIKSPQSDAKKYQKTSGNEKAVDCLINKLPKSDENFKQPLQTFTSKQPQLQIEKEISRNISAANIETKEPISDRNSSNTERESNKSQNVIFSVDIQPTQSKQKIPITSCEYQSTNLSDYISSINTPSDLSQLPSMDESLPQKFKFVKTNLPIVKLKQAESVKNLVKSIDEMTAPYEHLIRTKAWVEQSPPPPNRKSDIKQTPDKVQHPQSSDNDLKDRTDFMVDVAKSLHSLDGSSFIQQVTKIGDTEELYEKILGRTPDRQQHYSDVKEHTLEGVAEESSHTANDSCHEHSLIEGSLVSEGSLSNKNEMHSKMISNQGDLILGSGAADNFEIESRKFIPDPFNFINTWNRKPLGIASSSSKVLKNHPKSVSQDTRTNSQKSNSYSDISNAGFPHLRSYSHSSFVSSQSNQRSNIPSGSSNSESQMTDKTKLDSEISSHTPVHSSYTSFVTGSSVSTTNTSSSSEDKNYHDQTDNSQQEIHKLDNQTGNNQPEENIDYNLSGNQLNNDADGYQQEADAKAVSPSESSVSEIISVIANSKNGSPNLSDKNDASSENISSPGISANEKKSGSNIEEVMEFETNDKSSVSEILQKSGEGSLSEDSQGVIPEESSPQESIELKQSTDNSGNRQSPLANIKTSDSPVHEQKELIPENISEIPAPSKNGVTIDFTQPLRFTLSNGIPKSLKVLNDGISNEEQYLHTQVVTRVASEAAAAAASSAVIAVFETQKKLLSQEHEATKFLFPSTSKIIHQDRSNSFVSQRTPSNSGSSHHEDRFKSASVDSIEDEKGSPISAVKEDFNFSNEDDNISEHVSVSTKTSSSTIISERISVSKRSKGQNKMSNKKISSNLSSPSPASLSENDSISSAAVVSTNSGPSSSMLNESVLSDDSFARLTEDVVRKMSYEEHRRANHQLSVLKSEEKTLVENARAQMALLESIKKQLRDKGADRKASLIKKRQKELILRLRQERAQLRCMQEAYRGMCEMHYAVQGEEKRGFQDTLVDTLQFKKNKERSYSSKTSAEHKIDISRMKSNSSSTSAVLTEEESKDFEEEAVVSGLGIHTSKSITSTSQDSIIETVPSEKAKSTISSQSQTPKISPTSFPQPKQAVSQTNPQNHSNESALQGIKKLEASKRHLTKREQRILQRRKHVERLLQWQMKLDSEEMAVRELEQKALELVDNSKKKTKYYVSSSPSATPNENEKLSLLEFPNKSPKIPEDSNNSIPSDNAASQISIKTSIPKSIHSNSSPEEVLITSGDSIDEVLSQKISNEAEFSSSSIQEIEKSHTLSVKSAESAAESSCIEEIAINESSLKLNSEMKKDSNSDIYSESFESAMSQNTFSPSSNSSAIKNSTPSPTSKKEKSFSLKSPLAPRSSRRHDSSGSDDSYTISHSETASDQSDIEVRIHALSEELRRRRYEAEKLKREQKRKYREHLKGTELSLQKQVEAYNQYIQQVKAELEQIECVSSQSPILDISSVKPQIKWPRSEHAGDSRRMRKKPTDPLRIEKISIDHVSSSPESAESSLEFPMKQGKLPNKKLFTEKKENSSIDVSSIRSVLKEDNHKAPHFNESTATEKSSVTLNKESEIISDITSNNALIQTKDETDIEEVNESNSLIENTESISDKSNISVKEASSRTTYQSDSFVSSSSSISDNYNSETLKKPQESFQGKLNSANGNATPENISELSGDPHKDSENSGDTAFNESINSPEEYSTRSSSNTITNTESVKEELRTGSLDEEISEGLSSQHSKQSSEKSSLITENKLTNEKTPNLSIVKKTVTPLEGRQSLKEDMKSDFIVNVVTYLSSSMLEDAMRTVMNLSKNVKPVTVKPDCIAKTNPPNISSLLSTKKLTDKGIQLITNDLLNIYIKEAFQSFFNINNELKNSQERNRSSKPRTANNEMLDSDNRNNADLSMTKPNSGKTPEHKTDLAISPIPEKVENNIFKKNSDWLEDGYISAPWDAQQLDQQLLLQQYPYLYRKIPNKPPPPYTPPATINLNSQHMYPLPIRREKPIEKIEPIKHVTKHIDIIVDCIADCFIDGKRNGLMISDITQPNFSSVVEQLDLTNPCQITFLDLIFDLTKGIALEIYNETKKRTTWIRPRKLTPKPMFPTDKAKLKATLQKEVEKALKLLPPESYAEQRRKRLTWATMKLGRKKRDFVDTIIISEIKEEEPDWVNYDQEEVDVKLQIADAVFDYLIQDTVDLIKNLGCKFSK